MTRRHILAIIDPDTLRPLSPAQVEERDRRRAAITARMQVIAAGPTAEEPARAWCWSFLAILACAVIGRLA